ncbi:ester cyclase [Pseudodonghicola flavimaris]|uniref:Ester cyclase n=1 Tax=Pseudodonghicola flavimaris TaxID=3050036 RepID=A0ABT7F1P0_9RHOB|nr:nuclear transport factor 2 family protein [Pseudodonghicola flavimaris]MDK3018523.1 ester cyclase [Pseudodonghicola flavimaris]
MTKIEVLQRWCDEVWRDGNLDAIGELFDPSAVTSGVVPQMQIGPDDFRELVSVLRHHVGPIEAEILKTVEEGDWLAAMMNFRTSRADNGAPIEVAGQVMLRFNGDRMAEAYNHFDYLAFFEQLGLVPPDSLTIFLTGHKLDWA